MGIFGVLTDAGVRDDSNLLYILMAASNVLCSFCGGLREAGIDI